MTDKREDDVFKPFVLPKEVPEPLNDHAAGLDDFDPFKIGTSAAKSKAKSIINDGQPIAAAAPKAASTAASMTSRASTALPPRLDVKFKVHEEVSSTTLLDSQNEGSSEVFAEGTVLAQVTSSDALKNSPFILVAKGSSGSKVGFTPNATFTKSYASKGQSTQVNVIKIPKSTVGFVTVGKYKFGEKVSHLPMLLERKLTRSKNKIQVAIQVRSKLSNPDDMTEFSIALAISDKVLGDTVEINTGKGEWDRMTRTILWKLDHLPRGESFMVSVRAKLTEDNAEVEDSELDFPVMIRCRCSDQISSAAFTAIEASGYPATVSSTTVQTTYRIVHRLK